MIYLERYIALRVRVRVSAYSYSHWSDILLLLLLFYLYFCYHHFFFLSRFVCYRFLIGHYNIIPLCSVRARTGSGLHRTYVPAAASTHIDINHLAGHDMRGGRVQSAYYIILYDIKYICADTTHTFLHIMILLSK